MAQSVEAQQLSTQEQTPPLVRSQVAIPQTSSDEIGLSKGHQHDESGNPTVGFHTIQTEQR